MKKTNYLTNFPKTLFGSPKRKNQDKIRLRREKLMEESLGGIAILFEKWIPIEFLPDRASDKRQRVFTEVVTFWAWMSQMLKFNASCSSAVSLVQSWRMESGLSHISSKTASFCAARKKLSLDFIMEAFRKVVNTTNSNIIEQDLWHGMEIYSVDGSSVKLLDTEENQEDFPQPSTQKKDCGFPVMKTMGLLNHCTGLWEDFCTAHPEEHDAKTMSRALPQFVRKGLLLADRAFCSYEIIYRAKEKGMNSVMRLHQMRAKGFTLRKGKRIGKNERLVVWKKPVKKPEHCELSAEEWQALDDEMQMRIIACWFVDRDGRKKRLLLATTLLDRATYDWLSIANLYATRWDIEVRLRDVKTTMKMEELRVRTPDMARKSFAMAMLAYNLVRAVAQEASRHADIEPYLMSHKEIMDWVNSSASNFFHARSSSRSIRETLRNTFIEIASTKRINHRPYRWEPRLVKKRPKPFGLMHHKRKDYHAANLLGEATVEKYEWIPTTSLALN